MTQSIRRSLAALGFLLFFPGVGAHVFDKTVIEFSDVGETNTFTITDHSGCTASTQITVEDPSIVSVDPMETGFVTTFTYTVTALKPGKTVILVRWVGNTAAGCFDSGTQPIQITVADPASANSEAILRGITLDIHPIQVVQAPPFQDLEETVPLIQGKSTMARVFLIWSPPDPTVLRNVVCHLDADGTAAAITADIYYVGGKTYVIPAGSPANPLTGNTSERSRLRNGQEAFNFEFPATLGHHPGGSISRFEAHLESAGTAYPGRTEEFPLRAPSKTLHISFRTMESIDKPLLKSQASLAGFARDQFDRIVAVYPLPLPRAQMYFTAEPFRVGGGLGAFSTWLLEASLNTPGSEYIDLFVMIAAGKAPDRPNKPGRTGMVADWAGGGTSGYAPWYLDRTVYISEDSESFTTAHEYGHKLIGLGHSEKVAGNGWDVRHITSRSTPYKPEGGAGSSSGNFQALMWPTANSDSEGWISVDEYTQLIDSLTTAGARPSSLTAAPQGSMNLLISGEVTAGPSVHLNPFIQTARPPSSLPSAGPFAVRFMSASGAVLGRAPFDLAVPAPAALALFDPTLPVPDVENDFFLLTLPLPPDTARIEVVRVQDEQVLGGRSVSRNAPAVSMGALSRVNADGDYEAELTASDPDGDLLDYVVSYTPDSTNHIPLNVEWTEPNRRFRFSGRSLPGSSAGRVRVLVTDGVWSAEAYSPGAPFPNQKPLVSVLGDATIFVEKGPIAVRGVAYDPEEGVLGGTALEWRLDGNLTALGSDEWFTAPSLPLGRHTLILRATDSQGLSGESVVELKVVPSDQLYFTARPATGDGLVEWTGPGILERAGSVTGPWTNLERASSPLLIPLDQPADFYRLKP